MDSQPRRPFLTGVIGEPIGHSLSPLIHAHWLQQHQIVGHYVPLEVRRGDLAAVVKLLPRMGFRGVNITIPHKESALKICDSVSDQAALIGAVNTLTILDGEKIHGHNTDAYGIIQSLKTESQVEKTWKADDGPILVLGAGGAAKAVVFGLISDGAKEIHIVNRTREKAELIKKEYGTRISVHSRPALDHLVGKMQTIINTTSLGMEGKPPLPFPYDELVAKTVVLDLVYAPLWTELLREAKKRDCTVINGLGMLFYQAALSFKHWFNILPTVDVALREAVLPK